jgi:hypothetical protein
VEQILRTIQKRKAFHAFPARSRWVLSLLSWFPSSLGDWPIQKYLEHRKKRKEKALSVSDGPRKEAA